MSTTPRPGDGFVGEGATGAGADVASADRGAEEAASVAAPQVEPSRLTPPKVEPSRLTPPKVEPSRLTPPKVDPSRLDEAWHDPKLANVLYHDHAAETYNDKWSISFDERCIAYARGRFHHAAGTTGQPYGDALEIGCGTGFFLLNLWQAGVARRLALTDISPGMVAEALRNAERLGAPATGRVGDAERLPYPDASFDLVVGHAVLHHLPDVEGALREVLRVLRPGGRFVFAGEPTVWGDRVARRLSRATWWAATRITQLPSLRGRWARPREELAASSEAAALEAAVDLHTFDPAALAALCRGAGAVRVRTVTEELTAAWVGWPVRTFEAAVNPERLGWRWAMAAYRTWLALAALDERVLARVVPDWLYYNVVVTGCRGG